MASSAYLRRVSERTVQALLADPSRVKKVLFPSSTETVIDDEVLITLEAYAPIDAALGGDAFLGTGGTPIGDIVVGDGPARAFTADQVRRAAVKLALVRPADAGPDFATVKEFVTDTAKAEAAMIVYVG